MGMRIDTAINNLSMYGIDECGNAELHTWYNGIGKDMEESFMVAIETIHKYQKIQEIMKETHEGITTKYQKIEEVLEDGNDD